MSDPASLPPADPRPAAQFSEQEASELAKQDTAAVTDWYKLRQPAAKDASAGNVPGSKRGHPIALQEEDRAILMALASKPTDTFSQYDLEAATQLSQRTIGP